MTDRELLERAADAAYYRYDADSKTLWKHKYHGDQFGWNPLENSSDAFRLLVDCRIEILITDQGVIACIDQVIMAKEPPADDMLATTRRAITRAAAAIGDQK